MNSPLEEADVSDGARRSGIGGLLHIDDLVQERLQLGTDSSSSSSSAIPPLVERRGNVDLYYSEIEQQMIGLCHFYTLMPFTNGDKVPWNNVGTYEGITAVALAVSHLNTGNSTIITEVDDLPNRCPLRFTIEAADTELRESIAVNQVIEATNRPFWGEEQDQEQESGSTPGSGRNASTRTIHPCAFLGAARSAVSIPSSIITGLRGYPQISPISTSSTLNDKVQFPLFARTIPSDDGTAVPLILYFRDVLKIRHFGVVHINDAYGNAFAQGIQAAILDFAPDMVVQIVDVPVEATPETIERAISFLQATEYSYFFGILWPTKVLDAVIIEAHRQGLAGDDSTATWMFSDSTGGDIVSRPFESGSPLEQTFLGSGMFASSSGNFDYNPKLEQLTTALHEIKQSMESLNYIDSILPKHPADELNFGSGFDLQAPEFLQTPGYIGGFFYDATIAMGLAACQAWETMTNQQQDDPILEGTEHYKMLLQTSFQGTSGRLIFDETTGTRSAESAFYQIVNYVKDEDKSTDTMTHYKEVLSYMFHEGEWNQLADYVFNDGTTTPPQDLKPAMLESRHFSRAVRAGGLLFCGMAITTALGFATWTWYNRKHHVLTASQPIFLYLICGGAVVLVSTIIPLSIDEGVTSTWGCDIACRVIPWLLSLGFSIICSALFTKTYRINKIFNGGVRLRRVTVQPWDVAKPMILLLGTNVILLTLWTVLAPLSWDYAVEEEDSFGRVTERYGYCKGGKSALSYLIPLVALNFSILFLAVVQAYQARHISTQYAETDYIFLSMLVIVLACILGVPVLILAREDPDAYFFVFSGHLFGTSVAILLLIFGPKVAFLRAHRQHLVPPEASREMLRRDSTRDLSRWKLSEGSLISRELRAPSAGFEGVPRGSSASSGKGVSSSEPGLVILTQKSKRELLLENMNLRKRLRVYEKRAKQDDLSAHYSNYSVDLIVESSSKESGLDCVDLVSISELIVDCDTAEDCPKVDDTAENGHIEDLSLQQGSDADDCRPNPEAPPDSNTSFLAN